MTAPDDGQMWPTRTQWVLSGALAGSIFLPHLVSQVASVRLVVVSLASLLIASTILGPRRAAARAVAVVGILLLIAAGFTIGSIATSITGDELVNTNVQRLFVVTPILLALGYRTVGAPLGVAIARTYVGVGLVTAGLAISEAVLGSSLFGRADTFQAMIRGAGVRAIVGSEHALVLGALLAIAVPLCRSLPRRGQLPALIALLAGCAATGSRGPTAVAVLFAVLVLARPVARFIQRHSVITMLGALGVLAALFYLSTEVWATEILGASGEDYSANYRWALYASLPRALTELPFGYGLGAFPAGQWLVQSQLFGVKDILMTLDSELVYSAFTLGWLGVAFVLVAFLVAVGAIRTNITVGLAAAAASVIGFSLALHAWDSLGPVWIALTGAALAAVRRAGEPRVRSSASITRGQQRHRLLG